MKRRKIELLAPARDLTTGLEAIRHGADAVYIGAERFGARAAAGNSVEDIGKLVEAAHPLGVKVYVTLNTILYDSELEDVRQLIYELAGVKVDALIVQDMAMLQLSSDSLLPLHASTQMDNQTAEKVAWLRDLGFEQAVLARELTLQEIREIHEQVPEMRLEVFVHGAICVCYNGRCRASQYCFGRSANRGECAQFCRMPFDLVDEENCEIVHQRHLLSLRDMNRSQDLEELLDAGVSSLKIEGRLKDAAYVKNITAWYRKLLAEIFTRRPEYERSSWGHETINFEPNPAKSFNRGFTNYFLHGRTPEMANINTPKSMGEEIFEHRLLNNGDGLCYLDENGQLQGFRINKPDDLKSMKLPTGIRLFRNHDQAFEQQLSKPTATRKIRMKWLLKETPEGFLLRATTEDGRQREQMFTHPHELGRTPQEEPIRRQLSRLGDTPYETTSVDIEMSDNWFIPASTLADWRRKTLPQETPLPASHQRQQTSVQKDDIKAEEISNHLAQSFYESMGIKEISPAMEVDPQAAGEHPLLMTCRYCIRYELGMCKKTNPTATAGPLWLRLADGRRFRLHFDCKNCKMNVIKD